MTREQVARVPASRTVCSRSCSTTTKCSPTQCPKFSEPIWATSFFSSRLASAAAVPPLSICHVRFLLFMHSVVCLQNPLAVCKFAPFPDVLESHFLTVSALVLSLSRSRWVWRICCSLTSWTRRRKPTCSTPCTNSGSSAHSVRVADSFLLKPCDISPVSRLAPFVSVSVLFMLVSVSLICSSCHFVFSQILAPSPQLCSKSQTIKARCRRWVARWSNSRWIRRCRKCSSWPKSWAAPQRFWCVNCANCARLAYPCDFAHNAFKTDDCVNVVDSINLLPSKRPR
mgnify:CR=1 FL=1